MKISDIPTKVPTLWGADAGVGNIRPIPDTSQIGINPGYASWPTGYPPLNFTPVEAGGIPPFGQDMNGVLNQISAWTQWQGIGGPVIYDGTYQASIGGYPKGAIIGSATTFGSYWLSTVDDNVTNPDTGGAGWVSIFNTWPGAEVAIASATPNLGAAGSYNIRLTGTTAITGFGSDANVSAPIYIIRFTTVLTLTHGVNLILPTTSNITTAAGDYALAEYMGSGVWRIAFYMRASGQPLAIPPIRTRLLTDLDLYVATTGSDSNPGTVGSPFATIQYAWDYVQDSLDLAGYRVTINVANGTYTAGLSAAGPVVGGGTNTPVIINFASTSAIVSVSNNNAIVVAAGARISILSGRIQTATSGAGIFASGAGSLINLSGVAFGACADSHITCANAEIVFQGNCSIVGAAPYHLYCDGGTITYYIDGGTITITGSPNFSQKTAFALNGGSIIKQGAWSYAGGSPTGTRYLATLNSVMNVGSPTFFPGNAAGSVNTGAQYF